MRELYRLYSSQPYLVYSILLVVCSYLFALFFRKQRLASFICLVLAIGSSFVNHLDTGTAFFIVWALLIAVASWASTVKDRMLLSTASVVVILLLGVIGVIHVIPYYTNWKLYSLTYLGSSTTPYTLYYNLDKAALGAMIFLLLVRKSIRTNWLSCVGHSIKIGALAILVLFTISYLFGYVEWDPKFPSITLVWIICNLFFVCLVEEVFFRGFVLSYFPEKAFPFLESKERFIIGLGLSTVLYALYHYRLGWSYMILAFIAGLFYAWSYQKNHRVEYSTLTHFMVNAVHFFFFSYPILSWS